MSAPSTFECFGLVIHGYAWPDIRHRIHDAVTHGRPTWIVTANPEILLHARRYPKYWHILHQADLRTTDGVGLQLMGRWFGSRPQRLTGVDLAEAVLKEAEARKWSVAIVGGEDATDAAVWNLRARYPSLRIHGEAGGMVDIDGQGDEQNEEVVYRLTQYAPDILLVGLGHPKQEAWIARRLTELPSVKVIIGIGGTVDYWSGRVPRAPLLLRRIGLEWLWRLVHEPRRATRIMNAVLLFPLYVISDRLGLAGQKNAE